MVEAAINMASEQIVEFSAYGALLSRQGNRSPAAWPQNVYRSSDAGDAEAWVAVSVATDAQWNALRELLALEGSRGESDRIDAQLAAWCAQRCGDDIVDQLWAAGVPVAKVLQPHQQGELKQLQFRGYFEEVEHPVNGSARYSTLPTRFSAAPARFHTRHAPLFGEHSRDVLSGLGMSDAEIAALEADRVTATTPPAADR
jgi:crotonobetainyl-CoA:carnitine CoA-transferase CaiB-like acyl-CoA transferase